MVFGEGLTACEARLMSLMCFEVLWACFGDVTRELWVVVARCQPCLPLDPRRDEARGCPSFAPVVSLYPYSIMVTKHLSRHSVAQFASNVHRTCSGLNCIDYRSPAY